MEPIAEQDAVSLLVELRAGRVTVRALAESLLERIAERDSLIEAWAYIDPDKVRREADRLDRADRRGPLHGLPVAIKDVIATHDMPTQYGSPLYAGHQPVADAACVKLLRQAGALIVGKTSTVELASIGAPPRTRNPHAPDHTPGGSSSGSAAAVADGQVPLALGTQTGGSIIRPASFCGAWAIKPSWGTVSTDGVKSFAPSLDTIGWFGRSARDLRLLYDLFQADDDGPSQPVSFAEARFAFWHPPGWVSADAETHATLQNITARLERAGASVEPIEFAHSDLAEDHLVIMYAEGRRSFLPEFRHDATLLHPRICEMVNGAPPSPDRLRLAHDRASRSRAAFGRLAAGFDGVFSPSALGPAPAGLESTGSLLFNGLLTMLHVPVINLPLHVTGDGRPVGISLSGPRYSDRSLLAWAEVIADLA